MTKSDAPAPMPALMPAPMPARVTPHLARRNRAALCAAALALGLAGCDTPTPAFRGVPATRIEVENSVFDVRVRGREAEAIRISSEYAPRLEGVAPRAVWAIERASGCHVTALSGDQALIHARLKCSPKGPLEPSPYRCRSGDTYGGLILGRHNKTMICDPE
ncbi:MAG: hypothetical protein ACRBBT_01870 [Paracoccaceae bacterium]